MNPTPAPRISNRLRLEALLLPDGRGAILEAAREVSRAFREAIIRAAIVGGVAVFLPGYVRTTTVIDVFLPGRLDDAAGILRELGFVHDPFRREFVRDGLPVHLVSIVQLETIPTDYLDPDGTTAVSLADLVAMKLPSGSKNLLRAIDLADVIGLIRANRLTGSFTPRLPKDIRPALRRLIRAVEAEGGARP